MARKPLKIALPKIKAKPIKLPKIDIKKVAADATKVLKKAGQDLKYAPMLPFVLPMKAMLLAKKVKPENDLGKLARQFHQVIVKKNKNFDAVSHNLVGDIVSIVKDIVGFFANSKKKAETGKSITADEAKAADHAVEVEKALPKVQDKAKTSLYVTLGLGAAALAVILIVSKRK